LADGAEDFFLDVIGTPAPSDWQTEFSSINPRSGEIPEEILSDFKTWHERNWWHLNIFVCQILVQKCPV
jgi:hypothetical protein